MHLHQTGSVQAVDKTCLGILSVPWWWGKIGQWNGFYKRSTAAFQFHWIMMDILLPYGQISQHRRIDNEYGLVQGYKLQFSMFCSILSQYRPIVHSFFLSDFVRSKSWRGVMIQQASGSQYLSQRYESNIMLVTEYGYSGRRAMGRAWISQLRSPMCDSRPTTMVSGRASDLKCSCAT